MSELVHAILSGDTARVRWLATWQPELSGIPSFSGALPFTLARRAGRIDMQVALLQANAPGAEAISDYAELLVDYLAEISATWFAATWLSNIEYIMWDVLTTGEAALPDIINPVVLADVQSDLAFLSERCGGWVADEVDGPHFVPLGEWLPKFDRWKHDRG